MRPALLSIVCLLSATLACTREEGAGAVKSTPASTSPPASATPPDPEAAPPAAAAATVPNEPARPAAGSAPRSMLALPPEYVEGQEVYGKALDALGKGEREQAHALLADALVLQPANLEALCLKARLCAEDRRHDEGLLFVDEGLKAWPENRELHYQRAVLLSSKGELPEALTALELALASGEERPPARYLRAVVLAGLGNRDGALLALAEAVEHGFRDLDRLEGESLFRPLAADPRFEQVISTLRSWKDGSRGPLAWEAAAKHLPVESPPPPEALADADGRELSAELRRRLQVGAGDELPTELADSDGKLLRLFDHIGKPLVVEIWGTWSPKCKKQMPLLDRIHEENRDRGLQAVTLAWEYHATPDQARVEVETYLRENPTKIPNTIIDHRAVQALRVDRLPCTFFIARDGRVYLTAVGFKDYQTLRALTETLLEIEPRPGDSEARRPPLYEPVR